MKYYILDCKIVATNSEKVFCFVQTAKQEFALYLHIKSLKCSLWRRPPPSIPSGCMCVSESFDLMGGGEGRRHDQSYLHIIVCTLQKMTGKRVNTEEALQSGLIQMITSILRDNEIEIMKSFSKHSIQQNARCAAQRATRSQAHASLFVRWRASGNWRALWQPLWEEMDDQPLHSWTSESFEWLVLFRVVKLNWKNLAIHLLLELKSL